MVWMTGARCGRRSVRLTGQSSNPSESEESYNASEGHETQVMDEDVSSTNENTRGMDSPILRAIDDNVSLTTRSPESSPSPHTEPDRYLVFMAGETSAPINVEEQIKGGNTTENIHDLVKQWNGKINQITTQLQFLKEWMTGLNDNPPAVTPSSSNRKDTYTSKIKIDQIAAQMQQLSQRLSKQGGQSLDTDHQVDLDKPMTYREVMDMMTKTRDEGRLRKKMIMPKYPPEMDLVPYPPKYKPPTF
ncbi:hypothetical protein AAC387_Pa10g0399 [Persea americana]